MNYLPVAVDAFQDRKTRYVTFVVGEELFGLDIMCVESIILPLPITVVPRTPGFFLGIVNIRGDVVSVVDIKALFGSERNEITPDSRIIVIYANGIKLGMLVDKIGAIELAAVGEFSRVPQIVSSDTRKYVSGSFKLSDSRILLTLIHDRLIDERDFVVTQGSPLSSDTGNTLIEKEEDPVRKLPLVGFSISGEHYTLESIYVEEIVLLPEITVVPDMEAFVEGIFYLRESVTPLIRLGERLGLGEKRPGSDSQVIILKKSLFGIRVGLIVDDIREVFFIEEDKIVSPPVNLNKEQSEQLKGVFKATFDKTDAITMVLDLEKIFSLEEQHRLKQLDQRIEREDIEEKEQERPVAILEFMLANERYAVKVSETEKIIHIQDMEPVPKSPPFIKGIFNLRGEVVSVVDLPMLVGNDDFRATKDARIVVVRAGNEIAGLLVEKVLGIRKIALSSFDTDHDILKRKGNIFMQGIGKDDEFGEVVVFMDVETTMFQAQNSSKKEQEEEEILKIIKGELEYLEMEDERLELALTESN
ncbi:MAG: hypothetical protein GY866_09485 [Proteobacteria bacterium]|nr:hypothetical protein [Pseudomonadota bacterium]